MANSYTTCASAPHLHHHPCPSKRRETTTGDHYCCLAYLHKGLGVQYIQTCIYTGCSSSYSDPYLALSAVIAARIHHTSILAELVVDTLHERATIGVRIRGTLGDVEPLNKIPVKRAIRVKKLRRIPFKGCPQYYLGNKPKPKPFASQTVVDQSRASHPPSLP